MDCPNCPQCDAVTTAAAGHTHCESCGIEVTYDGHLLGRAWLVYDMRQDPPFLVSVTPSPQAAMAGLKEDARFAPEYGITADSEWEMRDGWRITDTEDLNYGRAGNLAIVRWNVVHR